jgi:hypothetical protein
MKTNWRAEVAEVQLQAKFLLSELFHDYEDKIKKMKRGGKQEESGW